jgi:hypothetical protein
VDSHYILEMNTDMPFYSIKSQNDSPLLRLPGEIRNKIYEYALGGNTILICLSSHKPPFGRLISEIVDPRQETSRQVIRTVPFSALLQLPGVCRQLRSEAGSLPYALSKFVVRVGLEFLERFVEALPYKMRSYIKTLGIPWQYDSIFFLADMHQTQKANLRCLPALEKITLLRLWQSSGFQERFRNHDLTADTREITKLEVTVNVSHGREYWFD